MTATGPPGDDVADGARAWRDAMHAAVCDLLEPWAHGTVARATAYPDYYDYNVVRVEDDPGMSAAELTAFADQALEGLEHRRVDFDLVEAAQALRPGFEANGWFATRLLWMRHQGEPAAGPDITVEEVAYDAVSDLRVAWHYEESPVADHRDPGPYLAHAREVAMNRRVQVLAVSEGGEQVAFAQLEHDGPAAEITQVYVRPEHRGAGRGTAMTAAAVAAAGEVSDLWIVADDEERAKDLYARIGFRPAWTTMEFLRPPRA